GAMAAGSAQPRERAPPRPPRRATQARPRAEGAARGGSRRRARGAVLEWRSGPPPPPPSSAPRGPTLGERADLAAAAQGRARQGGRGELDLAAVLRAGRRGAAGLGWRCRREGGEGAAAK